MGYDQLQHQYSMIDTFYEVEKIDIYFVTWPHSMQFPKMCV